MIVNYNLKFISTLTLTINLFLPRILDKNIIQAKIICYSNHIFHCQHVRG